MAAPRKISPDFRRALQQNLLLDFFIECAYVHRAGYLSWIAAANRRETRRQRVRQAVVRLLAQRAEETTTAGGACTVGDRSGSALVVDPRLGDVRRSA